MGKSVKSLIGSSQKPVILHFKSKNEDIFPNLLMNLYCEYQLSTMIHMVDPSELVILVEYSQSSVSVFPCKSMLCNNNFPHCGV